MRGVLFLFLFFCVFLGSAQNQNYQFKPLTSSNGLSQSSVISIQQDSLGYIWMGTRDGLNRYDGHQFTVYKTDDGNTESLSSSDILSLEVDAQHHLWVGTYNGLNRYDPKTGKFTRYYRDSAVNSLAGNIIHSLQAIGQRLFIGTNKGLSIYDTNANLFIPITTDLAVSPLEVYSATAGQDDLVYVGTDKGLWEAVKDGKSGYTLRQLTTTSRLNVQDVILSPDGNLLLGTRETGIVTFNVKSQAVGTYPAFQNLQIASVRKLLFDDAGNLWVGTYDGLYINSGDRLIYLKNDPNDANSIGKNSVKSLYKDKSGSIWIGTYYGGASIWNPTNNNFINYTRNGTDEGLNYPVISSIQADEGHIYFGTEQGGVNILDRPSGKFNYLTSSNSTLMDDNIKSLLIHNDLLWIGTFGNGLYFYDTVSKKVLPSLLTQEIQDRITNLGVYSIIQWNNSLALGTFGAGVLVIDEQTKALQSSYDTSNDLSSNLVRVLFPDSAGNLWVGTQNGLNTIHPNGTIDRYLFDEQQDAGMDILSVYEDDAKHIWAGTKSKGLFKKIEGKFIKVPLLFQDNEITTVHAMIEGDNGMLWLSSNQGIVKFDRVTSTVLSVSDRSDGLVGREYSNNAVLKLDNSQLIFGGVSGATSFNTNRIQKDEYAPPVIITGFSTLNGQAPILKNNGEVVGNIAFAKAVQLSSDQRNFTISFSMPSYHNASDIIYEYRLEGLEEQWIRSSNNSVSYTIQNAGNYTFQVRAFNGDGVQTDAVTTLQIEALAPLWLRWWAILAYVIIALLGIYLLVGIMKSRTRLQEELKFEQVQKERDRGINEAKLKFFTNISHEFRTPLTLILGPLQQLLDDYKGSNKMYKKMLVIESNAKHLLQLINRLMDFRKLEQNQFELQTAEGNLVKFIKEIFLSFKEYAKYGEYDYNFKTQLEEIPVFYDRQKLERVFFNLISNAFKYTPKGGTIKMRISKRDGNIEVAIKDSGIGISPEEQLKVFDRFYEVEASREKADPYHQGTGIGLNIAKNIVELHKGEITIESEQGTGSIFTVRLPLGREHLKEEEIIADFKFSDDISQYTSQMNTQGLLKGESMDLLSDDDKPTVLIVEDNTSLLSFMSQLLRTHYNVLEAENGEEAFKIAVNNSPDLIVSDVVMPLMAGTELCAKIKEDIRTSHIQVILLTSRSSLIYKLEGLESGADDYISKPFDIKEFQLRIKNLLQSKANIRAKFNTKGEFRPEEIQVTSVDEQLLRKAIAIVEENIPNENFDIPFFSAELGVSRTMLFIKIKDWTNFTPNEFIQHFRMKRAAQLLELGSLNISEVSYKVGFKNPKYFSKCFQKVYGDTPTNYSKKFSE